MFSLVISCLTTSNFPWFMDLTFQVPMQYCFLQHQSHSQLGVVLLWLHHFILSGIISPLISSSIFGTYWPGEFIFQCPIFLPFHTVHGVLKAKNTEMVCHSLLQWTTFCQQESLRRNGSRHHSQKMSPKCSTWMQPQKWQNDLCSFLRQTIQYHGNPSLCSNQ